MLPRCGVSTELAPGCPHWPARGQFHCGQPAATPGCVLEPFPHWERQVVPRACSLETTQQHWEANELLSGEDFKNQNEGTWKQKRLEMKPVSVKTASGKKDWAPARQGGGQLPPGGRGLSTCRERTGGGRDGLWNVRCRAGAGALQSPRGEAAVPGELG